MKKQLILSLLTILGLSACGGGLGHDAVFNYNPNRPDGFNGLEQPAAYTSMNGITLSPLEKETFELINEVRTKNTLRGVDISAFPRSCASRKLSPFEQSGLLSKLAQGHAQYLGLNGNNAGGLHLQKPGSPLFTGTSFPDRNAAAFKASGISSFQPHVKTAELVTTFNHYTTDPAALAVRNWLQSPAHCPTLFDPMYQRVAIGHAPDTTGQDTNRHNFVFVGGSLIR